MPGAIEGAMPLATRARASTMGRAGVCISASSALLKWQSSRAASMSRSMTARGLPYRCLRSRRRMTADSLVASAIERVVILGLALRAHGEDRHRGLRPVVGNTAGDGEARAAVGAVDKRIAVTPVAGIEKFAQAIGTGGRIGRNAGADLAENL